MSVRLPVLTTGINFIKCKSRGLVRDVPRCSHAWLVIIQVRLTILHSCRISRERRQSFSWLLSEKMAGGRMITMTLVVMILVASQAAPARGNPTDTRRWINVGLTLVQRRRRWTNGKSTLIQRFVSAGSHYNFQVMFVLLCKWQYLITCRVSRYTKEILL